MRGLLHYLELAKLQHASTKDTEPFREGTELQPSPEQPCLRPASPAAMPGRSLSPRETSPEGKAERAHAAQNPATEAPGSSAEGEEIFNRLLSHKHSLGLAGGPAPRTALPRDTDLGDLGGRGAGGLGRAGPRSLPPGADARPAPRAHAGSGGRQQPGETRPGIPACCKRPGKHEDRAPTLEKRLPPCHPSGLVALELGPLTDTEIQTPKSRSVPGR